MPPYRRVLLIVLALAVLVTSFWSEVSGVFVSMLPRTASIRLIDADDNTIPLAGHADVFELDRTKFLSSPRPIIGSIDLEGLGDVIVVDSERFPKSLQVRFHVPGYGVDFASVELGKRREHRLRLGPPVSIEGIVLGKSGSPLEGARVIVLGVASRGVVLAETTTNQRGRFELEGISDRVGILVLRVLKPGYAMEEREHLLEKRAITRLRNTEFRLTPVPPVRGVVHLPDGCEPKGLRVGVLSVPGITAELAADGSFTLHHLAPDLRYRLLLEGLPEGFAHGEIYARCGERVEVEVGPVVVVRGTLVSKDSGRYVPKAKIWHNYSTRGVEAVLTGPTGKFTLRSVPLGEHSVSVEIPESPEFPQGGVQAHKLSIDAACEVTIRVR